MKIDSAGRRRGDAVAPGARAARLRRRLRRAVSAAFAAALVVAVAAGLSACSSGAAAATEVGTRTLPGLGTVLVNGKGLTLYMFVPDRRARVTCVGRCAVAWPPDTVAAGAKPVAGGRARAALLGTVPDPNSSGDRVVTYAGWPLYTFTADSQAGQTNGQGLDNNGGLWFVLRPSGRVVRTPA